MGLTFAQRPATDIDPARHPNLADAQQHVVQAFDKIDAAQRGNHDQLGDHAAKAKDLLAQASRELRASRRVRRPSSHVRRAVSECGPARIVFVRQGGTLHGR